MLHYRTAVKQRALHLDDVFLIAQQAKNHKSNNSELELEHTDTAITTPMSFNLRERSVFGIYVYVYCTESASRPA